MSKGRPAASGAGHWIVPRAFDPDSFYGFIYEIECVPTKQRYIGKKSFHEWNKTGSKRMKSSNWRVYKSSSQHVKELFTLYGLAQFKFRILLLCCTKSCWSYSEANIMHKLDVMTKTLPNGSRMYLNKNVPEIGWTPRDCHARVQIELIRKVRHEKEALEPKAEPEGCPAQAL
jgi:hypothetical protein